MPLPEMLAFIALAALGSFVQALSGFALGLIVLGSVTLLQLAPITFTAAVISIISLINGSWVLSRHPSHIQWRAVTWTVAGLIPTVGLGLALLAHMDNALPNLLRQLLGGMILLAGMLLMLRPHPHEHVSGPTTTLLSGIAGGFLGGLFSTAGPPIVFHLYRQPWTLTAIRSTLITIFVISTIVRIGWQIVRGELHWPMLEMALYCTLPVIVAAYWGAHTAPRVAPQIMRRFAFGLLAVTGTGLLLPATAPTDFVTLDVQPEQSLIHEPRAAATVSTRERPPTAAAPVSAAPITPTHR